MRKWKWEAKQHKHRQKRKVARHLLPQVLAERGFKCHWCGCELILARKIRAKKTMDMTAGTVTWAGKGGEITMRFATVDHVFPLCRGGTSEKTNLVASCQCCNHKRNEELAG